MYRLCLAILVVGIFTAMVPLTPSFNSTVAHAACVAQAEDGNWTNTNADFGGGLVTSITLHASNCEDTNPHPDFYVRVFGRCATNRCDWGTVGANRLRSSVQIYAEYGQGPANTQIWMNMSKPHPGYLLVTVRKNYPGIKTTGESNYFRRAL